MLINRALPIAFAAVSALTGSACEEGAVRTSIGPSHLALDARFVSRAVSIEPNVLRARSVHDGACPTRQQFTLPFDLFVRAEGASALSVSEVRVRLSDRRGRRRLERAFAGTRLVGLFGSTLVPPFARRTFPFAFPLGCEGFQDGTLSVVVFTLDAHGRESRISARADVR